MAKKKLNTNSLAGVHEELLNIALQIALLNDKKKCLLEEVRSKYADSLTSLRHEREYGIVHYTEAGYILSETVPKKVIWDGPGLSRASTLIASMGIDPTKFIKTTLSVSETVYKDAPTAVRGVLDEARTIMPGTVSITIEKEGE